MPQVIEHTEAEDNVEVSQFDDVVCRTLLQFSMSSEYSLLSLGWVESPVETAQVRLEPPTPIAHVPRRSTSFRPTRTSLKMIVEEVPSAEDSSLMRAP